MALKNVQFRQSKGRFFKTSTNLNQQNELEIEKLELEETVSLNESTFLPVTDRSSVEIRLYPSGTEEMGTRELIGRTPAVANSLKKMPSEPSGLTGLSSRNEPPNKPPSPLENYSILEELGDSAYGKAYRVKRVSDGHSFALKCIAHQMPRPPNNDTSKVSRSDARALAIFIRELLSQHRINGHPNFLKVHDTWLNVIDLDDVPSTPSLGQPFDFNSFSLDRLHCKRRLGFKKANEEELVNFDVYGMRLLNALLKEQPHDNSGSIMIVMYMILDYCQYDLLDYISLHKSPSGDPMQIFLQFLQISLVLYDCDMVHLGIRPLALGLDNINHDHLVPRLLDFGINRYFEVHMSDIRFCPEQSSIFQAPENAQHEIGLSWPHDIYSLGLVFASLYFNENDQTRVLTELKSGNFHPLDTLSIPKVLILVLKRMLALEPDHRPTPWEILDMLQNDIPSQKFINHPHFSILSASSQLRLSIEMQLLRARIQYGTWLKQLPKSLWLGVVKSCAKEMLQRYLLHLGNLNTDQSGEHSGTVDPILFDVKFMLRNMHLDADISKCMEMAITDDGQLARATIWYLWNKYAMHGNENENCVGNGDCQTDWMKEMKDLYKEMWGNSNAST